MPLTSSSSTYIAQLVQGSTVPHTLGETAQEAIVVEHVVDAMMAALTTLLATT